MASSASSSSGPEATQIIVECVDARYGATGQVLEQRIGSKPFEVEHSPRPYDCGVEQELHLGVHRVDHLLARLEVAEVARQPPSEALLLNEGVEVDQSTNPRQGTIIRSALQLPDICPANSTAGILPFPARRPLAS
jgi:hypothetical protein